MIFEYSVTWNTVGSWRSGTVTAKPTVGGEASSGLVLLTSQGSYDT